MINAIPAEEEGGSTRGREQSVLARRTIWGGRNTRGDLGSGPRKWEAREVRHETRATTFVVVRFRPSAPSSTRH
jgi:hypothetical protein